MASKVGLLVQALVLLQGMTPLPRDIVQGPPEGLPRPEPRPGGLRPMFPRQPANPNLGWWVCACGAKANPYDKRWRGLSVKAKYLAMGWEDRGGVMVCPGCRGQAAQ